MAEYTKELIAKLKDEIKRAPRKPAKEKKLNKAGAVNALKAEIKTMQDKGYFLHEISAFLTEKGLPISKATLTAYLKADRTTDGTEAGLGETEKNETEKAR